MPREATVEIRETQSAQPERTRGGRTYTPSVDIIDRQNELLLQANVPGVKPGALDIRYERGLLTIHGRVTPRQDPGTDYLAQEYGVGDFYRRFEIGEGIDASAIAAELRDGVLTIHLPKAPGVLPRRISVRST